MRLIYQLRQKINAILLSALILICFNPGLFAQTGGSFNFSASSLKGVSITNPTSLQFGPDGRLYVSQQNGIIKIFTILRQASNTYQVTATETISLINGIPNYNDNGTLASGVTTRQVTGLLVAGTAANPILYVGSSDSRIGGPSGDLNLDTNSGIISRLTKNGSTWDKTDLVRGLPRSEENHANNGMQLDEQTNILYVTSGGFTNAGSPSNNFAFICEYALSAAILSVDLNIIEAMPTIGTGPNKYKYNLPTLNDPTRSNNSDGSDVNDPFGGNDGLNQAKIVAGGPVQIYSPGYRNAYDLVITKTPGKARRMYTIDNGANQGWGGHPANEGPQGNVTNNYVTGEPGSNGAGPNDPQVNNLDHFQFIGHLDTYVPGSHYGGHPVPVRANPAGAGLYTHSGSLSSGTGVWRTSKIGANPLPADWPPLPVTMAHPVEGDFQNPGETNAALLTFPTSTNGLAEYTASNFDNALRGNLLAAGYNGSIYRIALTDAGNEVLNKKGTKKLNQEPAFASGFGSQPLDVIAQGDTDIFPGTVWAATYGANAITVFEPGDFLVCSGADNTMDEDGDGYKNWDELDNATNPCSAASKPADFDQDFISDVNDSDDDNDGILDNADYFALDPANGTTTQLPATYDLFNNNPGTGLFGLGFTGLMNNKQSGNDYLNQFDEQNLIAGGAVGAFSIVNTSEGDALEGLNSQQNAFQFGIQVNTSTGPFTIHGRMLSLFFNNQTPTGNQSQGIYMGTGDQDNYIKIVLNANGGSGGIQVVSENAGIAVSTQYTLGEIPAQSLDLLLSVNPVTGTVQPKYARNGGTPVLVGSPLAISGTLLNAIQEAPALAVGIISTSKGATPFTATWDFINITQDVVTATGSWQAVVPASGTPTARHEASYVQAGDKFYLMGGRGIKPVQIYNPATKTWTNGAPTPIELHHFQAVAIDGLIYVVGAFTGSYPTETPVPAIYIYHPGKNQWITGPTIPVNRRRGAAGIVVYNNKIYVVCGITNGHTSGHVTWMDEFDPATNTWTVLPDAPRARDHFHAALAGNKLYAAAGRRTSYSTNQVFSLTVAEVDVFDFATQTWSTLPNNIPTKRAGNMAAVLGDELIIIGGESTQAAAHNQVEALHTKTNTWRSLANLLQGRHGTQAIVNNNGIYVAAGSGGQGGGPELSSQESFYLFAPSTPNGAALMQSTLSSASDSVWFGQTATGSSKTETITLNNTTGNQSIVITSLTIANNAEFKMASDYTLPLIIAPGKSMGIAISFTPASAGTKSTSLQVQHSGINSTLSIPLSGEGTTQAQLTYTINAGGPAVTINGKAFGADQYFSGGKSYSNTSISDIANTTDDAVYKTERSSATKQFSYAFPIPQAGTYTVKLHFAEIYWGATGGGTAGIGKRIFSVNLEGGTIELPNYDIYAEVGAMKAVIKTFSVPVTDGTLNIDFAASVNEPKVSAIEITPLENTSPLLSATPQSLHFFSQQAGTTSAPQTLLLTNTGSISLTVSSVSISGTNSSEFAHNFSISSAIAAGGSASVNITFTPGSLGTKTAQVTITHTGANSPLAITLTGEGHNNPNQPPVLANLLPDQQATVGMPFNFTFAANTFTDADGDVLTYTAVLSTNSALPSWLNFNAGTRTFSGTPSSNNPSSLSTKLTAIDGKGGIATDTFILTINAVPAGQSVASITLVNADTEQDIKTLVNGEQLNLATLPTKNLNIRANTMPSAVGSVVFNLNGASVVENVAPYALKGDDNGNYKAWVPNTGNYTLIITAFSDAQGKGTAGSPLTISFSVINQSSSPNARINQVESPAESGSEENSRIMVFPNPMHNTLSVHGAYEQETDVMITIFSTRGEVMWVQQLSKQKFMKQEIDVASFLPGMYFVKIQHGDNMSIFKIIKH